MTHTRKSSAPPDEADYDVPEPVSPDAGLPLLAMRLPESQFVALMPASRQRAWSAERFGRSARRCLPLMVANQAGWVLLNPATFTATWNGEPDKGSLTIDYADDQPPVRLVEDSFGGGAISFRVPYLFRTPRGWNLLARGPANHVKDGVGPLEGLIETDWAVATFTMNWKITRAHHPVTFEAGEPYCMVLPQRRGELERVEPRLADLSAFPRTGRRLQAWNDNRQQQLVRRFLLDHKQVPVCPSEPDELQYLRGHFPDGSRTCEHDTQRRLRRFTNDRS